MSKQDLKCILNLDDDNSSSSSKNSISFVLNPPENVAASNSTLMAMPAELFEKLAKSLPLEDRLPLQLVPSKAKAKAHRKFKNAFEDENEACMEIVLSSK